MQLFRRCRGEFRELSRWHEEMIFEQFLLRKHHIRTAEGQDGDGKNFLNAAGKFESSDDGICNNVQHVNPALAFAIRGADRDAAEDGALADLR